MIFHISQSGTPTCWSITSVYKSYYGIAYEAARAWYQKTSAHFDKEGCEIVLEIENGKLKRKDVFLKKGSHQYPDNSNIFLNKLSGVTYDEDPHELIEETIRDLMVENEVFIPRDKWEALYPASNLIEKRFQEFFLHAENLKKNNEEITVEDKWLPFVETPEEYIFKFSYSSHPEGYRLKSLRQNEEDPTDGKTWKEVEDIKQAIRFLNTGWTWEETKILLTPEPVKL